MYRLRFLVAASLLLLAASPLHAQRPAPPQWQVDWGDYYCSMIRLPGEGRSYATSFMTVPGSGDTTMLLVPEGGAAPPGGISSITLVPDGRTFAVDARGERRGGRSVVAITGLPDGFRELLAGAHTLELRAVGALRARIPLDDPRPALAEHRRCTSEISREWGVDEAALAALRRRPETSNLFGLTGYDYPSTLVGEPAEGRVIVRIDVSARGRATACVVVATSGSTAIDATTCRVVLRRARFRPGLDVAGRPVAARIVGTVSWYQPG